jgi:hypothetical protein
VGNARPVLHSSESDGGSAHFVAFFVPPLRRLRFVELISRGPNWVDTRLFLTSFRPILVLHGSVSLWHGEFEVVLGKGYDGVSPEVVYGKVLDIGAISIRFPIS